MFRLVRYKSSHRLELPQVAATSSLRASLRLICNRVHIKGLPTSLDICDIYQFISDYGRVVELATYHEMLEPSPPPSEIGHSNPPGFPSHDRKKKIYHKRPPGQTAIVTFQTTNSAIACKEELHWRPFPWNLRSILQISMTKEKPPSMNREDVISTIPRDRPLLTVHFETNFMHQRLRGWVKRDLDLSKTKVSEWEMNR